MHDQPANAPVMLESEVNSIRGHEWGGMIASQATFLPGADVGPIIEQLAAKHCHVPHWGYVLDGSITVGASGGDVETVAAGDMFYFPPGHDIVYTDEGCTFIEFSPADQMATLSAELESVLAAMAEEG